jgi:hypothetical protein
MMEPGFGADAAEPLEMDGAMSADVTVSIANDAARLGHCGRRIPGRGGRRTEPGGAIAAGLTARMARMCRYLPTPRRAIWNLA